MCIQTDDLFFKYFFREFLVIVILYYYVHIEIYANYYQNNPSS